MVFIPLLLGLYKNTHVQMQILQFIPLHFTSLRHSFISVGSSPPAAHNLACLAACLGCGFVMVFEAKQKKLGHKQKHIPNPCVSLLLPIAVARLYIQHRGRRTQPIPIVPHSIGFRRHAP